MSKPQGVVTAGTASTKPVYGRGGIRHPALRWPESVGRRLSGTWEPRLRCKRRSPSGRTIRARVRKRSRGAEQPVVAVKSWKQDGAKGLSTRGEEQWPALSGDKLTCASAPVVQELKSMGQPAMGGACDRGKAVCDFEVGGTGGV